MEKVIFIVGMGAGIGAAVARRFAREDYAVGAIARDPLKLEAQLVALRELGARAVGVAADASDIGALRSGLSDLTAAMGDPDVLVYNAAGARDRPLAQVSAEQFASDVATSITGAFTAAQCVLPAMRARRCGTVLLTGGGFAFEPLPTMASLGVGKAGLRNLAFSLHADLKDLAVHAATVTVCGTVAAGTPFDPERIADAYWQLHLQPVGAFSPEWQIRG